METTNINIRMEKVLKEQAESLFSALGMNMTTAFNVFARQAVRQGKIPFEIALTADEQKRQARKELGEVFKETQRQSVINGTDNITMDEINDIIAEVRQESRATQ